MGILKSIEDAAAEAERLAKKAASVVEGELGNPVVMTLLQDLTNLVHFMCKGRPDTPPVEATPEPSKT